MSNADSTRNRRFVAGLRELADWLEAHEDVGKAYGSVGILVKDRAGLEAVAVAFGDDARESLTSTHHYVMVERTFPGGLHVYSTLELAKVTDDAPPVYRPIIPAKPEVAPEMTAREQIVRGLETVSHDDLVATAKVLVRARGEEHYYRAVHKWARGALIAYIAHGNMAQGPRETQEPRP